MHKLLILALAIGVSGCLSTSRPAPAPAVPAPVVRDTHEQLLGALWMQTAAEYRVLASATYRAAGVALERALADPGWTAATEQTGEVAGLPAAVILDLDETVFDNSRFAGEQVLRRSGYTPESWSEWVALGKAGLVPGAREFLAQVRKRGVAVFFVTNRKLEQEAVTVENLVARGIPATVDEVLSQGERGWTGEKAERRQHVATTHRVLLLVGDDLGDFLPARVPPAERVAAAEAEAEWWGERWFLLPNPLYGSWDRALVGFENLPDAETQRRKFALVEGFEAPLVAAWARLDAAIAAADAGFTEPEQITDRGWVQRRLAHLVAVDQRIRKALGEPRLAYWSAEERKRFVDGVVVRMTARDTANTAELERLLATQRWFTVGEFGAQADKDAWLLVQHADRNVAFQERVLGLLAELAPAGETNRSNFAYLWDRVAVNTGKKQRYGTQGKCVGIGEWAPHDVESPAELETLRASVGLQTMAEYKELFRQYGLCQTID
jgi:5'-nucleotidase (lipoprotein e(P4) family)